MRKVTLCDERDVLEAIKNSASIQKVKVYVNGDVETDLLLETLRSLDLKALEVVCYRGSYNEALFKKLTKIGGAENTLSACWPGLRTWHLSCESYFYADQSSLADTVLWDSLPDLRGLQEVTVHGEPPDEMLPLLDGLRSIRMHGHAAFYGGKLVQGLASRLTKVKTGDCFVERYGGRLAGCVGLEELATEVQDGSEIALGKAIKGMERLRRLTLDGLRVMTSCETQVCLLRRRTWFRL